MATSDQSNLERFGKDPIYDAAWRSFIVRDRAALQLKNNVSTLRALVLLLGFVASMLAVLMSFFAPFVPRSFDHVFPIIYSVIPLLVIGVMLWGIAHLNRQLRRATTNEPVVKAEQTAAEVAETTPIATTPAAISQRERVITTLRRVARIVLWIFVVLVVAIEFLVVWYAEAILNTFSAVWVLELLRLILFVLPLLSAGIIAYTSEFLPSMQWAKYRYAAEAIRRELFSYRAGVGKYANPAECQKTLKDSLIAIEDAEGEPVTLFADEPINPKDIAAEIRKTSEKGDDGYTSFTNGDDYIQWRLVSQQRWYINRSRSEQRQMRNWRVVALVIGGAGSLLAFMGFEPWVAVTTSAAITLTALTNLKMQGRTYKLYHRTAIQLERVKRDWDLLEPAKRDALAIAELVRKTEEIFRREIDQWSVEAEEAIGDGDFNQNAMTPSANGNNGNRSNGQSPSEPVEGQTQGNGKKP